MNAASDIELSGAAEPDHGFRVFDPDPRATLAHGPAAGTFYICRTSSGRFYACIDVETDLGHIQLCIHLHKQVAEVLLAPAPAAHAVGWMSPAYPTSVGWMGPANVGEAPATPPAKPPPAVVHTATHQAAALASAPHPEAAHPAVASAVASAAHGAAVAASMAPPGTPRAQVREFAQHGALQALREHPLLAHPAVQAAIPAAAFAAAPRPAGTQWRSTEWRGEWGERPAWYGAREWRGEWGEQPAWWGAAEWRAEWGDRPEWWQPVVYVVDEDGDYGDDDDLFVVGAAASDVVRSALALGCVTPENVIAFQQAYSASGMGHLAITGTLDHRTQVALSQVIASSPVASGYADQMQPWGRHHTDSLEHDGFPVVHSLHHVANDVAQRLAQAIAAHELEPNVAAAARIVAKAHLGDLQAGRFIHRAVREARAARSGGYSVGFDLGHFGRDFGHAMRDVGHVADTLAKGAEFLARHVDVPKAIADHIPIPVVRGFFQSVNRIADPIYKFRESVHALRKGDLHALRALAQEQLAAASGVVSLVPGVGSAVGAAIGTAQALLDGGHPIEIALRAAYGALPIPPGLRQITDTVMDAVLAFVKNPHSLTDAALAVARDRIPSGIPRDVFDTLVHVIAKHQPIGKAAGELAGHYVRQFTQGLAPALEHGLEHIVEPAAASVLRALPAHTMKYAGFNPAMKAAIAPPTGQTTGAIGAPSGGGRGFSPAPLRPIGRTPLRGPTGRLGGLGAPTGGGMPYRGVASPFGRAPGPLGGGYGARPALPLAYAHPAYPYRPTAPTGQTYAQPYAQPRRYIAPPTGQTPAVKAPSYDDDAYQTPAAAAVDADAAYVAPVAAAVPAAAPAAAAPADAATAAADDVASAVDPVASDDVAAADADTTTAGFRGRPRAPIGRNLSHFGHRGRYAHGYPQPYAQPYAQPDDDDGADDGDELEQASTAAPVATAGAFDLGDPMTAAGRGGYGGGHHRHHARRDRRREQEESLEGEGGDDETTSGAFDLGDPMTTGLGTVIPYYGRPRPPAYEGEEELVTTSGAIDLDGPETMGRGHGGGRGFGRRGARGFGGWGGYDGGAPYPYPVFFEGDDEAPGETTGAGLLLPLLALGAAGAGAGLYAWHEHAKAKAAAAPHATAGAIDLDGPETMGRAGYYPAF